MNVATHPSFLVSAAAFTDVGQARKRNEDYVAYHLPPEPAAADRYGALLIVCDGVGGQAAGEVASEQAARRILSDYYQAPADQPPLERLVAAVQQANLDLLQQNAGQPDSRKMTTTVVVAAVLNSGLYLAHAGDSRAYLVRDGVIQQLTNDHSWVAEMVRAGDLSAEEAQVHPWRNRITRALGMREHVDVDAQRVEVRAGDIVVLCSDGLTRHVSDAEIAQAVTQQPARPAAQSLIHLANRRGGADNISVIVARLQPPGAPAPEPPAPVAAPARRPTARRLWPLFVVAALALLAAAGLALVYTQTDVLRARRDASPTPAPTLAPAETAAPAIAPAPTDTATPVAPTSTLAPTSTFTPTASPTRTPTPAPPQTPSATGAPPADQKETPPPAVAKTVTALATYTTPPAIVTPAEKTPPAVFTVPPPTKGATVTTL